MARPSFAFAAALVAASAPATASGPAGYADPFATTSPTAISPAATGPNGEQPLAITIDSGLQVGRLGLTGKQDGTAAIDPQTGAKQMVANMVDLGGATFQGKATVTGQPLKPVRIELPQTVMLRSPSGAEAQLSNFRTDLPPVAMLDAHGSLAFNFGATITTKDAQGGDFRGRIPIRVDYY
jgi:uncharacterized protein DUF4402